jgi:DUF177 domain-containing protein
VPVHASPFAVGVSELLRHPGTRREVLATAPLDDLSLSSARVLEGSEIEAQLTLEALGDTSVTATGTITAEWMGECRRCLATVEGTLRTSVQEIFESRPVEGETYPLAGDRVDLEPMVRDAVLLALPLAPLCEDACAGPDPEHRPVGTTDDPQTDDRWAALKQLKFD